MDIKNKISELDNKFNDFYNKFETFSKKYNFTVYKRWVTQPDVPGINGEPVPVCEFCSGLEGKEVLYTELWSHQAPPGNSPSSGKWYHGLEPGKVHKGCRCTYDIVIK